MCYSIVYWCTKIRAVLTGRSTVSGQLFLILFYLCFCVLYFFRVAMCTAKRHLSWYSVSVNRRYQQDSLTRSVADQRQASTASLSVYRRNSRHVPHSCGHSLLTATSAARCVNQSVQVSTVQVSGVSISQCRCEQSRCQVF